jgi:hypothetical protein
LTVIARSEVASRAVPRRVDQVGLLALLVLWSIVPTGVRPMLI